MKRCYSCFKEFGDEFDICPYCGQVEITKPNEPIHLAPGTVLADRYILGASVGAGGFGIVYKAWDSKLETIVAVKEFFVSRLVTRAAGMQDLIVSKKAQLEYNYRKERFLAEARDMAKFGAHRNIPNVFEFFEENNTAYIVMELLNGMSLSDYMKQNPEGIDIDFAIMIASEVSAALKSLHEKGIIHRDVAPDNIYICSDKEIRIKLMDLGAAKLADSTDDVVDIILKPGYSPTEQYDKSKNIGPWSDIYALGATLYVLLTGVKPDESTNRKIDDEVVPPNQLNPEISENLSNTVMKAMAVEKHMRFKTVDEFVKALNGEKKVISVEKEKKRRKAKRYYGIMAACLMLISVFSVVYGTYSQKKAEETLEPATINVWYLADNATKDYNDAEIEAMKKIIEKFGGEKGVYKDVKIELRYFTDADTYNTELAAAALRDNMPELFESTDVDASILENAIDVSSVLDSEPAKGCLFLDQYENYYADSKKIPLAIEIPVVYLIRENENAEMEFFSDLSDFALNGTAVAVDNACRDKNECLFGDLTNYRSPDTFPELSGAFLSSTLQVQQVEALTTNPPRLFDCVYPDYDCIFCDFTYEWSVSAGPDNEVKASIKLLSWMLGNDYQRDLMLNEKYSGLIPVNELTFKSRIEKADLKNISKIYKNFIFENKGD